MHQAISATAARFMATMLLGAALLFCVEPMVAKMIMPMLGGAPAVWITCMVFFQAALLAGYAYSHATTAWLGERRQAILHLVLVTLPLLVLPIRIGTHAEHSSIDPSRPIAFLLATLVVGVGPAFFVISTTAPLLQKWFSFVRPEGGDPYFLYGASNLGSLVSLAAYPALIEPHLGLFEQANAWRWGYCIFVAMTATCAFDVLRARSTGPAVTKKKSLASIPALRRARWVLLAFVPSSFLLSVTTYITTDVAAVPLFWVIPLGIYLATFVLVFAKKPPIPHALVTRSLPFAVIATTFIFVVQGTTPLFFIGSIHLVTFFLASMLCHGELAKDRPPPEQLTEFYLWVSVGGVVGGIVNGIVAPSIFSSLVEYPLVIVLACLCRSVPRAPDEPTPSPWLTYGLPVALAVAMLGTAFVGRRFHVADAVGYRVVLGLVVFAAYPSLHHPVRFGLAIAACLLGGALFGGIFGTTLHVERNFFGVVRVVRDDTGKLVQIAHGSTVHGAQYIDPALHRVPLTYYTSSGPLGQVFESLRARSPKKEARTQVGVIGLGAGTMATYRRTNEAWTYYEIDPIVIRIAQDPTYFTYLSDAFPNGEGLEMVVGDARLELRDSADHRFDMLVVDAFSSDSIPAHLLTREALALYRSKIDADGMLVVHISNQYLDLEPVFGNLARDSGMVGRIRRDLHIAEADSIAGKSPSIWVVLANSEASLGSLATDARWAPTRTSSSPVWSDDFSDLLTVFKW